jgi:hypothetical protein
VFHFVNHSSFLWRNYSAFWLCCSVYFLAARYEFPWFVAPATGSSALGQRSIFLSSPISAAGFPADFPVDLLLIFFSSELVFLSHEGAPDLDFRSTLVYDFGSCMYRVGLPLLPSPRSISDLFCLEIFLSPRSLAA